eukprot:g3036.t1
MLFIINLLCFSLETCNAPFAGTPVCARTSTPSPASVAVDVETPAVSVSASTTRVSSPSPSAPTSVEVPEEPDTNEPVQVPATDKRIGSGGLLEGLNGMVGKPGTMKSGLLGKKKGFGLRNKKKELFSGAKGKLNLEPEESTTFEDARKKLDIIKKNLSGTRNTISNSVLDGKKKVLDMKAGTPSPTVEVMTVSPKETAPSVKRSEDTVTLIPVQVDDREAANAVPVDIYFDNGVARIKAMN